MKRTTLPHAEWQALIRDDHPAYVSWDDFLKFERQLLEASRKLHFGSSQSPPREGTALLQGRAICGLCGQRMHVRYGKRGSQRLPNYVCKGRDSDFGDALCQSVVGTSIDEAISELVVQSVTPMALEISLAVHRELQARIEESDRLRHQSVERAQYEADRARQRYMLVDPSNRLVADSLEADWNVTLRRLETARANYEQGCASARLVASEQQQKRILALASDLGSVWNDPETPQRERKRMLALLVEDVTVLKQQALTLSVRFRGGSTTTLTLKRPMMPYESRVTDPDTRQSIDALADKYSDAEIANILNERGLVTGAGSRFDSEAVRWVRNVRHFKSLKQRLSETGWLTATELGNRLGVGRTTLRRWHLQGRLQARMCSNNGQWRYWPPDVPLVEPQLSGKPPMGSPVAKGAV